MEPVLHSKDIRVKRQKPLHMVDDKTPLQTHQCFPLVEGIFGPLRVPVMRSTAFLDAHYGPHWRTQCHVKVVQPSGRSKTVVLTDSVARSVIRRAWPSVELAGCSDIIGGFFGAGVHPAASDVTWRFAAHREVQHGISESSRAAGGATMT